jgi:hypothetical protein
MAGEHIAAVRQGSDIVGDVNVGAKQNFRRLKATASLPDYEGDRNSR